jgi:hypothetical protein
MLSQLHRLEHLLHVDLLAFIRRVRKVDADAADLVALRTGGNELGRGRGGCRSGRRRSCCRAGGGCGTGGGGGGGSGTARTRRTVWATHRARGGESRCWSGRQGGMGRTGVAVVSARLVCHVCPGAGSSCESAAKTSDSAPSAREGRRVRDREWTDDMTSQSGEQCYYLSACDISAYPIDAIVRSSADCVAQ